MEGRQTLRLADADDDGWAMESSSIVSSKLRIERMEGRKWLRTEGEWRMITWLHLRTTLGTKRCF